MKLVVIVQARKGSSRLPDKVLMSLAGEPLLLRMIERVNAARTEFQLVVATTELPEDEVIAELCENRGIACYRGHPTDLLDRHFRAALEFDATAVAKIPSDCPLIDPNAIDTVLQRYLDNKDEYDYAGNLHPPSWPDGNDVEVMSFQALGVAWREAKHPLFREHTTPFFWTHPDRFRLLNVTWETGLDYSSTHRWTIDYPADYKFISAVYSRLLKYERPVFYLEEVLELLDACPELTEINRRYQGETWTSNHADDLHRAICQTI